jgi:hypothetical protein
MSALLDQKWFSPEALIDEIRGRLGVTVLKNTLAAWRSRGVGPAYITGGKSCGVCAGRRGSLAAEPARGIALSAGAINSCSQRDSNTPDRNFREIRSGTILSGPRAPRADPAASAWRTYHEGATRGNESRERNGPRMKVDTGSQRNEPSFETL